MGLSVCVDCLCATYRKCVPELTHCVCVASHAADQVSPALPVNNVHCNVRISNLQTGPCM